MRLLQVCAVDFTAFHFLRPLLLAARDDDWDVTFACADGELATHLRAEGLSHWPIRMSRTASASGLLRAVAELSARLRGEPPDLIHTHTPAGGLVGRMAAFTWRGPVVHTFHGLPFESDRLSRTERLYLLAERVVARRTTHFFSQARGDVARATKLGIARAADTEVIGNGIDLTRFRRMPEARATIRRALTIPDNAVVVVMVGRLVREKGVLELADAAAAMVDRANAYFLIVGDALATDRTGVTDALDQHPVVARLGSRWRRLGRRDDVAEILSAADVFVLPTYREGLPRSIIEAMAVGLPVVATAIPACAELVDDGRTGLLVPARDATALEGALRDLVDNAERRRRMGDAAMIDARARHDERAIVRHQLEVLRALVTR